MHEPEVGARPPFVCRGLVRWTRSRWSAQSWKGRAVELVEVPSTAPAVVASFASRSTGTAGSTWTTIATISDKLARRLDLEDFGEGRYQLEVSTPGIERSLRTPAQFARASDNR